MDICTIFDDLPYSNFDSNVIVKDKMAELLLTEIVHPNKCNFDQLIQHIKLYDWCGNDEFRDIYARNFIKRYWDTF
jgi:hypothetical protein